MFGLNYAKFQPSEYVIVHRKGKIVKQGAGLSFYYYAPVTTLVVVPIASSEEPFIFEEQTSDFQTLTIQGQVTYRIVDHQRAAELLNFTFDLRHRKYLSEDPFKLPQRIINMIHVTTKKHINALGLQEALRSSEKLADYMRRDIRESEEIARLGIEILSLTVLGISPNRETARALEANARENILKTADEALYERRNASIDQERVVKENEFNTEIAIENKKRQVRETQLEAERNFMQRKNQLKEEQLHFDIALEEKKKSLVALTAENARAEADVKAYELASLMSVFEGVSPNVIQSIANMGMKPDQLIAMAFQGISENAAKIGQLNISPDLLTEVMRKKD